MSFIVCRTSRFFGSLLSKSKRIWIEENQGHIVPSLIQNRSSSYRSSDFVHDIKEYPEVEIVKNPEEWKYVERLLPKEIVPKPEIKSEYPSGWKPPAQNVNTSYFIPRTKNHMIPVYLETNYRGMRRITVIRKIQGDIWSLENDLRKIIEKSRNELCASRVNEMSCQIRFHGDYVNLVKDYLMSKGF